MSVLRRRRGGSSVGTTVIAFLALTIVSFVIAGVVIADRSDPGKTDPKALEIAPQLDTIQPGATEQEVRKAFGEPFEVQEDFGGSERCLFYENLPSNQPAYRFCFRGGKLEGISPQ